MLSVVTWAILLFVRTVIATQYFNSTSDQKCVCFDIRDNSLYMGGYLDECAHPYGRISYSQAVAAGGLGQTDDFLCGRADAPQFSHLCADTCHNWAGLQQDWASPDVMAHPSVNYSDPVAFPALYQAASATWPPALNPALSQAIVSTTAVTSTSTQSNPLPTSTSQTDTTPSAQPKSSSSQLSSTSSSAFTASTSNIPSDTSASSESDTSSSSRTSSDSATSSSATDQDSSTSSSLSAHDGMTSVANILYPSATIVTGTIPLFPNENSSASSLRGTQLWYPVFLVCSALWAYLPLY